MDKGCPAIGVCGWSGSGKTTLIEKIIPILLERGLKVAVVKHDAHGIDIDREGRDSDRLFKAGADVFLDSAEENAHRVHAAGEMRLEEKLWKLAGRFDLIIVEGYKSSSIPKLWFGSEEESSPPEEVQNILEVLLWDSDRLESALAAIENRLAEAAEITPLYGCVLIGGKSSRMGKPKHLIVEDGKTWLAGTIEILEGSVDQVVISGKGDIPEGAARYTRLPDARDAEGPMAGILAAMRWAPRTNWVVAACDMPGLTKDSVKWLLEKRRPGAWIVMPKLQGAAGVEPLFAFYDYRARNYIERAALKKNYRLNDLAAEEKAVTPEVPQGLAATMKNANEPGEI